MISYGDRRRELGGAVQKAPTNGSGHGVSADLERDLLDLMGGVLGERIDAEKAARSFADLGLGSLLAVRLIEAVNKTHGLELGVETVFAHPSPRALAAHLSILVDKPARSASTPVRSPRTGSRDGAMAIIGLSGAFGPAPSLAAFAEALAAGKSLVGPLSAARRRLVEPLTTSRNTPPVGGFLEGVDLFDAGLFGLSPREARAIDPQQRLFLERAYLALENAGYPAARITGKKVGVYVGASPSGYERLIASDGGAGDAWGMTGNLTALLASRISYHLDLGGPALTVDTACSSSLVALDLAVQGIRNGDCDTALVGGVSLFLDPEALALMGRAGMLSKQGRCATFDASADGIVIGEAAVALVIKPLDRALAEGDRIDAVVLATATNQDGRSNGITAPNSAAQSALIRVALERAGLDADAIDVIEAHGTGTPLGDPVEIAGLAGAFSERSRDLPPVRLGSAKAALGHSSEAAGLVGVAKVVAALKAETLPPLTGFSELNPRIDLTAKPLSVPSEAEPWPRRDNHVRRAGVSSFGLAGTNAHAVVVEGPVVTSADMPSGPVPLLLSAEAPDLLAERAVALLDWLEGRDVSPADLAGTLALRRSHHPVRAGAMVASPEEARKVLAALARGEQVSDIDPLVEAYLRGGDGWAVDYAARFGTQALSLDLPDQPLAREAFWAFEVDAAEPARLPLSLDDPKVGDHRVGGQAILHAAALLDIALDQAGEGIGDIAWLRPVTVGADGAVLTVTAGPSGSIAALEDGEPVFRFAAAGKAEMPARIDLSDLLAIQAGATATITGGVAEPAPGVWLGPSYRGFDRLSLGSQGAVGSVDLTEAASPGLRALDAAIQAAAAVAATGDRDTARTRMPTRLQRLALRGPIPAAPLHLIARRDDGASSGADTVVDVTAVTAEGTVVMRLEGLTLHAIGAAPPVSAPVAAVEDPPLRLHRLVWRESGTPAAGGLDPRPTLLIGEGGVLNRAAVWLTQTGSDVTRQTAATLDAAAWFAATEGARRIVLNLPPEDAPDALDRGACCVRDLARAAAAGEAPLDVVILAPGAQNDPVRRGLVALAQVALGREIAGASVRTVDAEDGTPVEVSLTEPGAATGEMVVLRDGKRFEPSLEQPSAEAPAEKPQRVVIVGGFGRVGRALAGRIAKRWKAGLVLIGREAVSGDRPAYLDSLRAVGVHAHGLSADMTDPAAAGAALREAREKLGGLDLVIQAVVDPVFGRLSAMPEAEMLEGLRAKTAGGLAVKAALRAIGEGRLAVVSSIGAFAGFPGAAGQAVYAAQCAFESALADESTQVVHWGLWADPSWRADLLAQVRADGLFPMPEDAAFEAFERALSVTGADPLVAAALSASVWRGLGDAAYLDPKLDEPAGILDQVRDLAVTLAGDDPARHAEVEAVAHRRLLKAMAEAGLLGAPGTEEVAAEAVARFRSLPRLTGLAQAVLDLLVAAGAAERLADGRLRWSETTSGTDDGLETLAARGEAARAVAALLADCVDALPQVLAGEVLATDLLFPGGSMAKVEPIYADQPGLEAANALVAETVACLHQAAKRLSVLEIGAGTGATAAAIRARLGDGAERFSYRYTDISAGFVRHGEKTHAAPWLSGAVLDIERDPAGQGFAAETFDVAVASNVLHATARIDETLAHAAGLLRPGGVLLLNENVRLEAFATLTFGLLDGWWRSQDPQTRLAGGPLLDLARWRRALRRAGLDVIAELAPGNAPDAASQVVIVAVKAGRCAVPIVPAAPAKPATRPAPVARAAAAPQGTLRDSVRQVVAEALGLAAEGVEDAIPFADYGVDSIVSPQISETLAERFQVALRSTDLFSYATVEALADHIEALGPTLPIAAAEETPPPSEEPAPVPAPAQPAPAPTERDNRIAVIGLAGRFPDAPDVDTFWRNLRDGHCAIRPIDRFPIPDTFDAGAGTPTPIHARWAGLIDDFDRFDPLFFQITPAEALTMDPQQRLLLEEAWHAIEDAGLPPERIAGARTGVFVGASANSYIAPGAPALQTIGGSMAILSARLAYLLDLRGPTFPIDTGCSSSLVALSLARDSLLAGQCDVAIAGGVGCNLLSEEILAYLSDAGMASPTGVCHAFDDRADGFVPGEGVGVLVLKRLADAERDGDRIRAVILGAGINQDGRTSGITAPSAASQTALERRVWQEAGVAAESITLVEAHGTGTRLGDPIEVAALTDAFAAETDRRHFCAIGSVKTNIGHAMAAAGLAGMIKAMLALENRTIPRSLSFENPNRHIDFDASPFTVATETRPWSVDGVPGGRRRAAVSSFGFSGTNAHVVLEEAPEPAAGETAPGPWIFVLSAKTPDALDRISAALADYAQKTQPRLGDVAYTLALRRGHFRHRRAVIAAGREDLVRALRARGNEMPETAPETAPETLRDAASAYLAGKAADFASCFPGRGWRVVSLPGYPFARERYWQPLRRGILPSEPMAGPRFAVDGITVTISLPATDWRLDQHRVQGRPMLPAAAMMELIDAALTARNGTPAQALADLVWHRPVAVTGGDLSLALTVEGSGFRLFQGEALVAEGRIDATAFEPQTLEVTRVDGTRIGGADLREAAQARGIAYGPRFAAVTELQVSADAAEARLSPDARASARTADILDAAMQAAAGIGAVGQGGAPAGLYVPHALGRLVWLAEGRPARVLARTLRRDASGAVFDIAIADDAGRMLAKLEKLVARRLDDPAGETASFSSLASTTLHAPRWSVIEGRDTPVLDRVVEVSPGWLDGLTDLAPGAPLGVIARLPDTDHGKTALADLARIARGLSALPSAPSVHLMVVMDADSEMPAVRAAAAALRVLAVENAGWGVALVSGAVGVTPVPPLPSGSGAEDLRITADGRLERRVLQDLGPVASEAGPLEPGTVVVISGGLGGLGKALAGTLSRVGLKPVLLSRRPGHADAPVVVADVTSRTALDTALETIRREVGPIGAVLHLAGERRDGLLSAATAADIDAVFTAKVDGLVNLDAATRKDPLALFAVFGSTSAEFGSFGQGVYGAANAAAAGLMAARSGPGLSLCIAWPLWKQGGMTAPDELVALLKREAGLVPLPTDVGTHALWAAVASGETAPVVLYGTGDVAAGLRRLSTPSASTPARKARVADAAGYLATILSEVAAIPVERVEPDLPFEEYGIDSMMITRLNQALERDLGALPKTLFFEYRTPSEVAAYLSREKAAELAALAGSSEPAPAQPTAVPKTPTATAPVPAVTSGSDPEDGAVAIIGIAGIFPGAEDLEDFWTHLVSGTDLIREVPADRWPLDGFYDPDRENISTSHSKWGGFIDGAAEFDPRFFDMAPVEAEALDPQARKMLEVAWWALEDAGYTRANLFAGDPDPALRKGGVFVGLMHSDYPLFAAEARARGELAITASGYWNAANRISHLLDFQGPSVAVDTACSASLTAIHSALRALAAGDCTVAIAGGVNLSLHPMKYWVLSKAGFASTDGRCRSFGEGGDGYVPGEGAGAVILKPLARAKADGDRIHAVIRASAVNHGGRTSGFTVPNPVAQGRLIADALNRAGVAPGTVSYVEAHGTGTALGDPIEITGLKRAFGGVPGCPIGSVKSNIGHLESAAGIAALAKVVLQMRHRTLAPSLHAETPNPDLGIEGSGFRVVTAAEPWTPADDAPLRAGISSFGAGGANVHLIVDAPPTVARESAAHGPLPFPISARTPGSLKTVAARLADSVERLNAPLADIAFTLAEGREALKQRAVVMAADRAALVAGLRRIAGGDAAAEFGSFAAQCADWMAGRSVDWRPLLPAGARRTGLPLTPFERRRCWITTRPDPAFNAMPAVADVIPAGDPLIADHLVDGESVAAGALLLAEAVRKLDLTQPFAVADVNWRRTVTVGEEGLSVEPLREGERVSILANGEPVASFSLGNAGAAPAEAPALKTTREIDGPDLYRMLTSAGVSYGPAFARIAQLSAGPGAAVAELAPPSDPARGPLDARVLDAALQACAGIMEGDGTGLRPASIGTLTLWRPLADARRVVVRRRGEGDPVTADIALTDAAGQAVARLDGLVLLPTVSRPAGPPLRLLRPSWVPISAAPAGKRSGSVVIVDPNGEGGLAEALAAALRGEGNQVSVADTLPEDLAEIVYLGGIGGRGSDGVLALARLAKTLAASGRLANRPLLRVVTDDSPSGAAVTAFAKALSRELDGLRLCLIRLPSGTARDRATAWANAAPDAPQDAETAVRDGAWYRLALNEIQPTVPTSGIVADGRYLIAGGSGGIGRALGRHLAESHGATVWLVGRRPLTAEERASIADPSRGRISYLQADLTDAAALKAAVPDIRADAAGLDGVIHAALVMDDRLVVDQSEDEIARILAPKTAGIDALMSALEGVEVRSWIAFSSSNAYTANQGQAAYAAASAYLDAAVLSTGADARAIDWGLWGEVGRMADDPRTAGLKRMGIWPIATAEGLAAFERILAGDEPRVLAMKLADTLLAPLGVETPAATTPVVDALERMMRDEPPAAAFDGTRLEAVDAYAAAALAERLDGTPPLAPIPEMKRLAEAIVTLREEARGPAAEAKRRVEAAGTETAPYMALLDHALPHVRDVVEGRVAAANVLFPEGSDRLVAPIYQGNPMIDWLQRLAARAVAAAVEARLAQAPDRPVRVLEVGGGTGGTTGFALEALAPFGDRVAYTFTDIGPSFLVAARRRFADTPGFQAKLLDAVRPAADQGFEEGGADVVLAANVVHATPRIADTLGNLGRLLSEHGVLVLKEATGIHAVNTLTFGLTSEWWGYADPEVRMPGGPLLSRSGWRAALTAAGYSGVGIAGLPGDSDGTGAESVIVAAAPKGIRAAASAPARTARPSSSGKADGEIERKLIAAVAEALHLEPDEIDLAASFADYGADSIISVELVRKINESFGIELKTTALFNFATVRDLARYIALEFGDTAAPDEGSQEDEVAARVGAAKARTSRLRDMIDKRRTAAPVNAEADFLAREAEKTRAHRDPDRPGAMSMETLLKRLEAGEIALEDAYETEVSDDA